MKTWQTLGILVATASLAWWFVDQAKPPERGPARRTTAMSASTSADASVSPTTPRWRAQARPYDHTPEAIEASRTTERKPVRPEDAQACETSDTCGDARACVDGQCVHCVADSECEGGMICALSRCMVPDDVECGSDEACGEDGYCVTDLRTEGPARSRYFSYCANERQHDALVAGPVHAPVEEGVVDVHVRERAELFAQAGFGAPVRP